MLPEAVKKPSAATERRRDSRLILRKAFTVIPVRPDGSPDADKRVPGLSLDLSSDGIGLELMTATELPSSALMLVFPGQPACCVGAEVRNMRRLDSGRVRAGGRFGGPAQEVLQPGNLSTSFCMDTMEFGPRLSEDVLACWAELGVLEPYLADRVQTCPKCQGLPTFRPGCKHCGSARLGSDRLIHHFPCAYVGFVEEFETAAGLACPKCRTRHLVVGSDYEYLNGPHRCVDCGWTGSELENVAQCLRCEFRFPAHQACLQDLRGYRANRLDPLALLQER